MSFFQNWLCRRVSEWHCERIHAYIAEDFYVKGSSVDNAFEGAGRVSNKGLGFSFGFQIGFDS